MCTPGETWRSGSASASVMAAGSIPRSPSHESVNTDLSLFSVSSAASDAKVLKLLACKAGQGPDPLLRVASPNPDSKLAKRGSRALLSSQDNCRDLLAGCAALCAALGLRRSFSTGDVGSQLESPAYALRSTNSELGVCAALEARALGATSRSCSTWVAVGGSQLPSPQRAAPPPPHQCLLPDFNKKVRQNYIKRRLLSTYRALERVSQSEFNLDRLERMSFPVAHSLLSFLSSTRSSPLVIPSQEAGNALMTPSGLRVFMDGGDRLLSDGSPAQLLFNYAEKNGNFAAAANAVASAVGGPGPTTLTVPHPNSKHHTRFVHPEAAHLALTAADLERERGRPLSKYERNMMIFNWLHTLDEAVPF